MEPEEYSCESRRSSSQLEFASSSQIAKKPFHPGKNTVRSNSINASKPNKQKRQLVLLMSSELYSDYLRDGLGEKMALSTESWSESKPVVFRLVQGLGNLLFFKDSNRSECRETEIGDFCCKDCEPFVLAVMLPVEFLDLITATNDPTDFPTLRSTIEVIFAKAAGLEGIKKILSLVGLEKQCVAHQRKVSAVSVLCSRNYEYIFD